MKTALADVSPAGVGVKSNRPDSGSRVAIETFMRGGSPSAVPAEALIDSGLAGYAVSRANEAGEALDGRVKAARIALAGRHLATKRLVAELFAAWLDQGMDVLVFKGFALAEFVYADPTWRTYSDVDVLLRAPADGDWPAQTARAAAVAVAHGFKVYGRPEYSDEFDSLHGDSYVGPTILHLVHRRTGTNIDVHRRIIHNGHDESRRVTLQERIT
ncbi:MAG TPA: nucleotidyltransferase family protein, partial [Trueperaceae bacterium]|nr:nucleotidyltransferase family protein [Trueperaceae bacterium]